MTYKQVFKIQLDRWLIGEPEKFLSLDKDDEESFCVLLRISSEFYKYLCGFEGDDYPDWNFASYAVGTIRSGIDSLFELHPYTRILKPQLERMIDLSGLDQFHEFKLIYITQFERLSQPSIMLADALSILFDLWRLKLIFVSRVI